MNLKERKYAKVNYLGYPKFTKKPFNPKDNSLHPTNYPKWNMQHEDNFHDY